MPPQTPDSSTRTGTGGIDLALTIARAAQAFGVDEDFIRRILKAQSITRPNELSTILERLAVGPDVRESVTATAPSRPTTGEPRRVGSATTPRRAGAGATRPSAPAERAQDQAVTPGFSPGGSPRVAEARTGQESAFQRFLGRIPPGPLIPLIPTQRGTGPANLLIGLANAFKTGANKRAFDAEQARRAAADVRAEENLKLAAAAEARLLAESQARIDSIGLSNILTKVKTVQAHDTIRSLYPKSEQADIPTGADIQKMIDERRFDDLFNTLSTLDSKETLIREREVSAVEALIPDMIGEGKLPAGLATNRTDREVAEVLVDGALGGLTSLVQLDTARLRNEVARAQLAAEKDDKISPESAAANTRFVFTQIGKTQDEIGSFLAAINAGEQLIAQNEANQKLPSNDARRLVFESGSGINDIIDPEIYRRQIESSIGLMEDFVSDAIRRDPGAATTLNSALERLRTLEADPRETEKNRARFLEIMGLTPDQVRPGTPDIGAVEGLASDTAVTEREIPEELAPGVPSRTPISPTSVIGNAFLEHVKGLFSGAADVFGIPFRALASTSLDTWISRARQGSFDADPDFQQLVNDLTRTTIAAGEQVDPDIIRNDAAVFVWKSRFPTASIPPGTFKLPFNEGLNDPIRFDRFGNRIN